jgi:hypothetical protein
MQNLYCGGRLIMSAEIEKGNFEIYLKKYCEDHGYTIMEAMEHALIREIKQYYEETDKSLNQNG